MTGMSKTARCGLCGAPLQRLIGEWVQFARDHAPSFGLVLTDTMARGLIGARVAHAAMVHDDLPVDVDGNRYLPAAARR